MRALNEHSSAFFQGQIADIADTMGKLQPTVEDSSTTWGNKVEQILILLDERGGFTDNTICYE